MFPLLITVHTHSKRNGSKKTRFNWRFYELKKEVHKLNIEDQPEVGAKLQQRLFCILVTTCLDSRRFRHLLQLKPTQIYHIQMSQDCVSYLFVFASSLLGLKLLVFKAICIFSKSKMHQEERQSLQSKMHQAKNGQKAIRDAGSSHKIRKRGLYSHTYGRDKQNLVPIALKVTSI